MENFSQNPLYCSPPNLVGAENFFAPNLYGAFQPFSAQVREESKEEMSGERVEDRVLDGEGDCEIIGSSKKRAPPKQKVAAKKKVTPKKKVVKVEGERDGEGEEANRLWEDSEVLQLIALKGEMEPEFERNGKKQGLIFFSNFDFFPKVFGVGIGAYWRPKGLCLPPRARPPFPPIQEANGRRRWGLNPNLPHYTMELYPHLARASTHFSSVMKAISFYPLYPFTVFE